MRSRKVLFTLLLNPAGFLGEGGASRLPRARGARSRMRACKRPHRQALSTRLDRRQRHESGGGSCERPPRRPEMRARAAGTPETVLSLSISLGGHGMRSRS